MVWQSSNAFDVIRKSRLLNHLSGLRVRVQPSPIHGVGLFAIRPIEQGSVIGSSEGKESSWITLTQEEFSNLAPEVQDLVRDYYPHTDERGQYHVPEQGFKSLDPTCFINVSLEPNTISTHICGSWYLLAKRDIAAGEEITGDYYTPRAPC
jgi:SET domain-containing protein